MPLHTRPALVPLPALASLLAVLICAALPARAQPALQADPALLAQAGSAPATAPEGGGTAGAKAQLRPLEIVINQTPVGSWTLLEQDGGLYATPEAVKEWRLQPPPNVPVVSYRGKTWLALFALPGYRARFDFASQSMALEFAPAAFTGTRLAGDAAGPPPLSPVAPALFLNYDLSHTASGTSGADLLQDTSALTEFGLAVGAGTLTSSHVGTNLGNTEALQPQQWRRLETTWTQDFPARNQTLRLGDTTVRPALWGRTLYFGGLQFGSNFGLTPGFVSQALPSLSGTASSPGTVELYINNALRQTANVPAGPFTIENINPFSGAGEARVVVRDVLGRETVVVRPFFTNNNLLTPGLADWSVSLGRERFNLGSADADYRDLFASGLYRRGMSDNLTLEGQAEWTQPRQSLGMGLSAGLAWQALGQAALALSQDEAAGSGSKLLLGVEQQTLRSGFGARLVLAQRGYRELGFAATELPYEREQSVNYRYTFNNQASLTLGSARLDTFESGSSHVLSASYSLRVGERGALVFNGTQIRGSSTGYALGVSLVLPLDGGKMVTASATQTDAGSDGYAAVSSALSGETGTSWRALAGSRSGESLAEGGVYYQGNTAYLGADLSVAGSLQTLRLNAQGALVAMAGSVFAARRLQESFALVEVPGYAGVGVGFQGAPLTHTDSQGRALLPRLAAYQSNSIRLDPNDLPFSAELDSIEQTAVPAWRSGVRVTFPVRAGRGALLRIVFDDGAPAPPGAQVLLAGDSREFFVGRRGEAYVTGLEASNTLELHWKEQTCRFAAALPPSEPDDIPRLGPLLCQGVTR